MKLFWQGAAYSCIFDLLVDHSPRRLPHLFGVKQHPQNFDLASELKARGVNVNEADSHGRTALMYFAMGRPWVYKPRRSKTICEDFSIQSAIIDHILSLRSLDRAKCDVFGNTAQYYLSTEPIASVQLWDTGRPGIKNKNETSLGRSRNTPSTRWQNAGDVWDALQ